MKTLLNLILAGLVPAVAGFRSVKIWSIGEYPSATNETEFRDAIQSSNASRSVPFQLGQQSFQLRASVAVVPNPSDEPSDEDLAAIFTQYTLAWEGDSGLNATVAAAENVTDDQQPRLCATIPARLFSASVTNGYDFDEPGSCAGAFGSKCAEALSSWGFGGYIPDCGRTFNIPEECEGIFPGGYSSGLVLSNETQSSPQAFAHYSEGVEPGSPRESAAFSQEENRLHVLLFADQHSQYPVCLRIRDEHVSKGDPSTAGALSQMGRVSWELSIASLLLLGVFFWP